MSFKFLLIRYVKWEIKMRLKYEIKIKWYFFKDSSILFYSNKKIYVLMQKCIRIYRCIANPSTMCKIFYKCVVFLAFFSYAIPYFYIDRDSSPVKLELYYIYRKIETIIQHIFPLIVTHVWIIFVTKQVSKMCQKTLLHSAGIWEMYYEAAASSATKFVLGFLLQRILTKEHWIISIIRKMCRLCMYFLNL